MLRRTPPRVPSGQENLNVAMLQQRWAAKAHNARWCRRANRSACAVAVLTVSCARTCYVALEMRCRSIGCVQRAAGTGTAPPPHASHHADPHRATAASGAPCATIAAEMSRAMCRTASWPAREPRNRAYAKESPAKRLLKLRLESACTLCIEHLTFLRGRSLFTSQTRAPVLHIPQRARKYVPRWHGMGV